MSEIRVNNLLHVRENPSTVKSEDRGDSFSLLLREAIGKLEQIQSDADRAVRELATGGDITQAVIAMQKAELSFQLMIEVRNRLLSAYEEIQRMQV
ncbi:MAG: flagellar hook-basal body complex protein FliE [Thermodesulfovibrionales bacterium]|nr:flagellar hook-basal body complex protein FliE [Thermodesulfovibrionales bacterium]